MVESRSRSTIGYNLGDLDLDIDLESSTENELEEFWREPSLKTR